MAGTLAIDIETISPGPDPVGEQFRDSTFFELLAVGVGYRSADDAPVETDVLFRADETPDSELALVESVRDWIAARDAEALLTYNGAGFDLLHLRGRAELAADAAGAAVPTGLDALESIHDDLMPDAWDAWGEYTSLERACAQRRIDCPATRWDAYEHGMRPDEWRGTRYDGDERVRNVDLPRFGERYLALATAGATETRTFRELRRLIFDYTVGDIEPLFALADSRPFDG